MNPKISIFSILDSPALGGAEKYLLSNLEFLSQQGFEITLATYNQKIHNQYQKKFHLINLPYRLDLIGNIRGAIKFFLQAPLAIAWMTQVLIHLKRNHQQVIVYTPGFTERLVFSPFIKLMKLKLIWVEFGPVASVLDRNFGLPKLLYQLAKNFPDRIITISQNSKLSMLRHASIEKNKVAVIYPGTPEVTSTQLKTFRQMGREWKRKHQLKSKKIITFVGRLATEKELGILLKAFSKLEIKDAQLVIVGTGPEKETYQKLAKELAITDQVLFTGYVSEDKKATILAISDIFVFPSAWKMEGFGMTTIEAMMMGVPVISTGAGPQTEIITDRKTGLFFKAHNKDDLSSKIKQLLMDKKLAQKLATNGRKKALAKFSQTQMLHKTLQIIKSQGVDPTPIPGQAT